MRILHIYKVYYPESIGGVEQLIATLTTQMPPEYEHTVLTTTHQKTIQRYRHHGVEVIAYPVTLDLASCPMSLKLWRDYRRLTKPFDVLHYHFPWPYADFLHLSRGIRKPFIVTYHSDVVKQKWLDYLYAPWRNAFLKKAARIIATSENYCKTSPILKRYPNTVHVIPVGLPPLSPIDPQQLAAWQARVGSGFFFFVGVLRYYKGLHFLLSALKNLPVTVVIAGNGPEAPVLQQQAKTLGLSNVIFVGKVDDASKAALFQLAKAVIVPAHLRSEAFCLTLVEGLQHGKPLISTEIGTGTSFVNQHDITGLVVEPASPTALADAMLYLQSHPEECARFGINAKQRFVDIFTSERMINYYKTTYREL